MRPPIADARVTGSDAACGATCISTSKTCVTYLQHHEPNMHGRLHRLALPDQVRVDAHARACSGCASTCQTCARNAGCQQNADVQRDQGSSAPRRRRI